MFIYCGYCIVYFVFCVRQSYYIFLQPWTSIISIQCMYTVFLQNSAHILMNSVITLYVHVCKTVFLQNDAHTLACGAPTHVFHVKVRSHCAKAIAKFFFDVSC